MKNILIVDDDRSIRHILKEALSGEKFNTDIVQDAESAIKLIEKNPIDLVITDLMMPGITGLEMMDKVKPNYPDVGFIFMTAFGTVDVAVDALKKGAFDFIAKPFSIAQIEAQIDKYFNFSELVVENKSLKKQIKTQISDKKLIGESPAMKEVKTQIEMVAYSDAPVFLMGESGTGKELISESIHNSSERSKNPYLKVNCAAIPKDLIESTLFGHEKGAFTGALKQHKGLFEESNSGTLLLDEISEMPLPMQTKLLRILQEGTLTRVGSNKEIKVDVRVIATSNRKIYEEIDNGNFREDLFYRLNVFPINIPPLRERKEDIPLLVNFFISDILNKYKDADKPLDQSAMNKLINYSWPGNIRELRNIVERAYLLSKNDNEILSKHFILENTTSLNKSKNISSQDPITIAEMEKELIYNALERLGDNRNKAAEELGITVRTLRNKLHQYGEEGDERFNIRGKKS